MMILTTIALVFRIHCLSVVPVQACRDVRAASSASPHRPDVGPGTELANPLLSPVNGSGISQHFFRTHLSWWPGHLLLRLETIAAHVLARIFERECSNNHTERKEGHKSPGSRPKHTQNPQTKTTSFRFKQHRVSSDNGYHNGILFRRLNLSKTSHSFFSTLFLAWRTYIHCVAKSGSTAEHWC